MIVFLNGEFLPEEQAMISVFDRGFLFGDAVFEAILVRNGKPFRWDEHIDRLRRGAEFLKFTAPVVGSQLRYAATELVRRNQLTQCMMRLTISRGITPRGYSPRHATNPASVITLHPAARRNWSEMPQWSVVTSSVRVPANDPLTAIKTANKIHHVLARAEADDACANEAVLLNSDGNIAEGAGSNIFWVKDDAVWTPSIACGPLPGVTRGLVLELCRQFKIPAHQVVATRDHLHQAQGVFLTMTSFGVVEATSIDCQPLRRAPLTRRIHDALGELLNVG